MNDDEMKAGFRRVMRLLERVVTAAETLAKAQAELAAVARRRLEDEQRFGRGR